jgi:hypothetical protein
MGFEAHALSSGELCRSLATIPFLLTVCSVYHLLVASTSNKLDVGQKIDSCEPQFSGVCIVYHLSTDEDEGKLMARFS